MQLKKFVLLKLFFNVSNMTYYVQIGENLYPVKTPVAIRIQEKEGLDIRRVKDIKDMQIVSSEDQ